MRTPLESGDPPAANAVDLICHRISRELGAQDPIAFAARLGEHAPPVRERMRRGVAWAIISLDVAAIARHGPTISTAGDTVAT